MSEKSVYMPLVRAISEYGRKKTIRFHMPGHKGRQHKRILRKLSKNLYNWDVTEIAGLDDYHQPSGPIKLAQERLAHLYGADKSFFSVNGASCGVIALMGASLLPGDEILVSRASHRSVLSGLIITGARPIYAMPEFDAELGVYTQVTVKALKEAAEKSQKFKAVIVSNPNYQGFCPDLKGICRIARSKKALFLADEAQGPHFHFSANLPESAGMYADGWVQSPHKMLTSLTQSAWIHIKGNQIDSDRLRSFLQLMTTSSPSYILMASLDIARAVMEVYGVRLVKKVMELAQKARELINKHTAFYCVGREILGKKGICGLDTSRLMVNVSIAGYTGFEVDRILRIKYNIYAEYADSCNIYFLTSFCNTERDIRLLINALSDFKPKKKKAKGIITLPNTLPKKAVEPAEAFNLNAKSVHITKASGCVAKDAIVPYPPGIPLFMPGEVIEKHHVEIIQAMLKAGARFQGITKKGLIKVLS